MTTSGDCVSTAKHTARRLQPESGARITPRAWGPEQSPTRAGTLVSLLALAACCALWLGRCG